MDFDLTENNVPHIPATRTSTPPPSTRSHSSKCAPSSPCNQRIDFSNNYRVPYLLYFFLKTERDLVSLKKKMIVMILWFHHFENLWDQSPWLISSFLYMWVLLDLCQITMLPDTLFKFFFLNSLLWFHRMWRLYNSNMIATFHFFLFRQFRNWRVLHLHMLLLLHKVQKSRPHVVPSCRLGQKGVKIFLCFL